MAKGTCSIPGCGRTGRLIRGWCSMHYQRWWKYGEPTEQHGPTPQPQEATCGVAGCFNPTRARGWCNKHWQQWYAHGDPTAGGSHFPYPANLLRRIRQRSDGCWAFQRITADGYGAIVSTPSGLKLAHVAMYELVRGPVPAGYDVDHLCHTPGECVMPKGLAHLCPHRRCVRPDHIRAVPAADNRRRSNATLIKYGKLSTKAQGVLS